MTGTKVMELLPFSRLREAADTNPVAHACIALRTAQITALDWDIVPSPDLAATVRADWAAKQDCMQRRENALRFFRRPDPEYLSFTSFLRALLDQSLTIDAVPLLMDTGRVSLLDGTRIEPALGRLAEPAGFRQYAADVPRRDIAEISARPSRSPVRVYGRGDLLHYLVFARREWTPFGESPVEKALDAGGSDQDFLDAFALLPGVQPDLGDERWLDDRKKWLAQTVFAAMLTGSGLSFKWGES